MQRALKAKYTNKDAYAIKTHKFAAHNWENVPPSQLSTGLGSWGEQQ